MFLNVLSQIHFIPIQSEISTNCYYAYAVDDLKLRSHLLTMFSDLLEFFDYEVRAASYFEDISVSFLKFPRSEGTLPHNHSDLRWLVSPSLVLHYEILYEL